MALLPPVREKNSTKKGRKRKRKLNDRTRERNDYPSAVLLFLSCLYAYK